MSKQLEMPSGDYSSVVRNESYGMFHHGLADGLAHLTKRLLTMFCESRSLPLPESVSHMSYAMVAFAAFSMQSAAKTGSGGPRDFDPVAFGKRCEEIAREQAQRYATLFDTAGTT